MLHVEDVLITHIKPVFKPEARITLLVRIPDNPGAEVMLSTDDDFPALQDALARSIAREDQQSVVREAEVNHD